MAHAQVPGDRPVRRVELSIGAGLFGGAAVGERDASLRANSTTPQPYRLFSTASRFADSADIEARAGFSWSRRLEFEGRFAFNRPELRTAVSSDAEGASPITLAERVDQYLIDGGALFMLEEWQFKRTVPFAAGGAGYVRQRHEGKTLIDEGHLFYVGGGVKRWWLTRRRGAVKTAGVRADARLYLLGGGVSIDDRLRRHGTLSGSVFVGF